MDAPEKPFHPYRRETLAGSVRAEIERLILAGDLSAGDKLNENLLADSLGVSRGTVREAVRTLAQSGLIELIANRGAFVRRLSLGEINNLYDLRGAIFAMACAAVAKRCALQMDDALVTALNENLEKMREAFCLEDKAEYYALNIAFHDMLMDAARNPRAKSMYDSLVKEMHLFRRRGLSFATNIERSIEEHAEIVRAVEDGNEEAAQSAARRHLEEGHKRFLATLSGEMSDDVTDSSRNPDTRLAKVS